MANLQFPITFCGGIPTCESTTVKLPFGLAPVTVNDPCCQGFDLSIDQLNKLLAPIAQFLTAMQCVTEIFQVVIDLPTAITDAIALNPKPLGDIANKLIDFSKHCMPLLLSFTPPGAVISICCMLVGVCEVLLNIIVCLQKAIVINVECNSEVLLLSKSTDDTLRQMGICLSGQTDSLSQQLLNKVASLLDIFKIINLIISIIPPTKPPLPPITHVIDISAPITDPTVFNDIIIALQAIITVAKPLCG